MRKEDIKISTYVSDDGKRFVKESECLAYEKRLETDRLLKSMEVDCNVIPITDLCTDNEDGCYDYNWYQVSNADEDKIIRDIFAGQGLPLKPVTKFPYIICIKSEELFSGKNKYVGLFYLDHILDCVDDFMKGIKEFLSKKPEVKKMKVLEDLEIHDDVHLSKSFTAFGLALDSKWYHIESEEDEQILLMNTKINRDVLSFGKNGFPYNILVIDSPNLPVDSFIVE